MLESLSILCCLSSCSSTGLSKNDPDCLEGEGVSRVTVAQRRRDSQARRPSALKGLEVSLLLDRAGFP